MSTTTNQNQTANHSNGTHGRRGGNRGRGGKIGSTGKAVNATSKQVFGKDVHQIVATKSPELAAEVSEAEEVVCWICAEPVKYWSVPECNHRTCHVCSLRLRALYKKTDCTFCKDPQPSVIFTVSPDASFASFTPNSIPYKDSRLSIFFETEEMMEETMILLRFNCPDFSCDYIGTGWGDLKLHIRSVHGRVICDLCVRTKKVFSHEHALYTPAQFPLHLPSMPHNRQRAAATMKGQLEGGTHPMCEFCRECFFGDDELYHHMRERHEECFICKRNEIRDQYFLNWASLEKHFNTAHHPCIQSQCLAQKFVVFNSPLDLKAHMVEEHAAEMSSREAKDARRIQADFEFEEVHLGGRLGRGRRDRGERDRDRDREPPPPAPQHQIRNVPPAVNRRREGFGANLTVDASPGTNNVVTGAAAPRRASPSPVRGDIDPAIAARHAEFTARLNSLTSSSASAVAAVKASVRGFRSSESSARDLISTIWNILDQNLDQTASLVSALVDLLDDEDKKKDLLSSWNGFKIEQRQQFPDLVPSSLGSGYAGIATGRVLNAKHSTATRSSQRSSRQVWDRVAQAAGSSRFPALPPPVIPAQRPTPVSGFRQEQRNTPWSASSSSGFRPALTAAENPPLGSRSAPAPAPRPPPPVISNNSFPTLPTTSARQKAPVSGNVSLRNIIGDNKPAQSAWQSGSGSNGGSGTSTPDTPAAGAQGTTKGKKGKGKQKQTLFTLGNFAA